jgi:anti-sigma regulatory factor (Ser/Thr protein kinase)
MEVATHHRTMPVTEPSQPSAARFLAREVADRASFGEDDAYRAGLIATEMSTNLVKHARGGEFLARITSSGPDGEIELIALDRGPGMRDSIASLRDGHSTAGTPGNGLGAIRRLADSFDLFSTPGRGTIVVARVRGHRAAAATRTMSVAAVSVAKPGETVCGDAWDVRYASSGASVVIADGLGHGLQAAEAAEAAVTAFRGKPHNTNIAAMEAIHLGIRHTRGAAGAIAEIHRDDHVVRCVGVGNIATAVWRNGAVRQAVSHNGTLGHEARVIREYTYPWAEDAVVVMHSDGLVSHWSLDEYRGLRQRHPSIIAALLYRDFNRGRDDVTVVVGKATE